jgi:hypothetical protein
MMQNTCSDIEEKFPLNFIPDYKESDKILILESIKSFKNPLYKSSDVQFYEGRDIRILAEFFSRYGDIIRQTDSFGCEKIEGKFCVCYINNITEADLTNITQAIKIYRGLSDRENAFNLLRDRDVFIITEFFSRYGSQIRNA